jgi:hypothetical protein
MMQARAGIEGTAARVELRARRSASRHMPRSPFTLLLVLLLLAGPAWAGLKVAVWADSSVRLEAIDSLAGMWDRTEPAHHLVGAEPVARPACMSGQAPALSPEFEQLRQAVGELMGEPRECVHADGATGDRLQVTSTGLAVYRPSLGQAMFTDGYRHWAIDQRGLIYWEGDSNTPGE